MTKKMVADAKGWKTKRGVYKKVRERLLRDLKAGDTPKTVERLLKAYLKYRKSSEETFLTFARRHDGEALRKLADAEASA